MCRLFSLIFMLNPMAIIQFYVFENFPMNNQKLETKTEIGIYFGAMIWLCIFCVSGIMFIIHPNIFKPQMKPLTINQIHKLYEHIEFPLHCFKDFYYTCLFFCICSSFCFVCICFICFVFYLLFFAMKLNYILYTLNTFNKIKTSHQHVFKFSKKNTLKNVWQRWFFFTFYGHAELCFFLFIWQP